MNPTNRHESRLEPEIAETRGDFHFGPSRMLSYNAALAERW